MDGLLTRLSSYQFITSLVPGAGFLVFLYLIGYDIDPNESGSILLMGYIVGLFFNRLGGLILRGIEPAELVALYRLYRDEPQAEAIYDTFVLYRTMLVALFFAVGALAAKNVDRSALPSSSWLQLLALLAFAVTFFFAWRLQRFYLLTRVSGGPPVKPAGDPPAKGGG